MARSHIFVSANEFRTVFITVNFFYGSVGECIFCDFIQIRQLRLSKWEIYERGTNESYLVLLIHEPKLSAWVLGYVLKHTLIVHLREVFAFEVQVFAWCSAEYVCRLVWAILVIESNTQNWHQLTS